MIPSHLINMTFHLKKTIPIIKIAAFSLANRKYYQLIPGSCSKGELVRISNIESPSLTFPPYPSPNEF